MILVEIKKKIQQQMAQNTIKSEKKIHYHYFSQICGTSGIYTKFVSNLKISLVFIKFTKYKNYKNFKHFLLNITVFVQLGQQIILSDIRIKITLNCARNNQFQAILKQMKQDVDAG